MTANPVAWNVFANQYAIVLFFKTCHLKDDKGVFPKAAVLEDLGLAKLDDAVKHQPAVDPNVDLAGVCRAVEDKSRHQDQQIQHLRRIHDSFQRDQAFVKIAVDLVFEHVFFDADAGSHKEEYDQGFRKQIDDAGQDQKRHG